MVNKIRALAIEIIEEIEDHVSKHKKPFDQEAWYEIEDTVYDIIDKFFVERIGKDQIIING